MFAAAGEDALCFRLSVREPSEKRAPFTEVWRSTEASDEDSYSPPETHGNIQNNNNLVQLHVAPVRIRETLGDSERTSSPGRGTVKPEQDPESIKEEQVTLPVWDLRDDEGPKRSGSWDAQVDGFPNLSHLHTPDLSPHGPGVKPERGHPDPIPSARSDPDRTSGRPFGEFQRAGNPPPGRLRCTQCGESFALEPELAEHQRRRHAKERPHVCPACGKAFTRFSNFKQHVNIHTHEKLFNCTQCSMSFKRSTHLRVHLRRHARAGKSAPCCHCGKTFMCIKQLKDHLIRVHGTGKD